MQGAEMKRYKVFSILMLALLAYSSCEADDKAAPSVLNVVDIRQATPYTCGVSSSQVILNYFGIDKREDQLAGQFGTTEENGTSPSQIIAGLKSYGLTASLKENTTLEELKENIKNKIPTMVAIQAWSDNPPTDRNNEWEDGHWVIVIGMDDQNVYFEDPVLLGTRGWISKDEFLQRWHDYSGKAPCCDENDKILRHLSISVTGTPAKRNIFTHID